MKKDLSMIVLYTITGVLLFSALTLFAAVYRHFNPKEEPPPMSQQNVVCDTVYGVQYFENKGSLTMRVNHEGNPIRCFEE